MVNSTFDFSDFSAYMSVRIKTPDPTRVICTLLSASVKIGKAWKHGMAGELYCVNYSLEHKNFVFFLPYSASLIWGSRFLGLYFRFG